MAVTGDQSGLVTRTDVAIAEWKRRKARDFGATKTNNRICREVTCFAVLQGELGRETAKYRIF